MLYTTIVAIWLASEIFLNRIFRSGPQEKQKADRKSLLWIWVTIMATLPLGSYVAEHTAAPITSYVYFPKIGIALIVSGMLFRFYSIYTLGHYFTVDVTIREDHRIVQHGVYKYLRHPSYLGSLVSFIGNGIAMNNYIAFVITVLPVSAAFLYRMYIEERVLINNFGEEYRIYRQKTYRLIPFIF
ncbi:isoprenylcysteine carboxylmethyltransferase family protein [Chitinophaga sp.]|jgi:protein-S-isoprenylcysteine O-methyltransferase Ste14|uniref:methyltransferase family protein n=1 Tax=Chitinophaga sp. TaxID=1869181 RepID=UPI0031D8858C